VIHCLRSCSSAAGHIAAFALVFASASARAQEPAPRAADEPLAFNPDRPGFADATGTVPKGHLQLEAGVRAAFEEEAIGLQSPSVLVRVGVTDWAELRFSAPDMFVALPKDGDSSLGLGDVVLGVKFAGESGIFSASAIPFISLPTGTQESSSGEIEGGAGINLSLEITEWFAIGANGIAAFVARDDGRHAAFSGAGLSFGFALTEALAAYVEGYATHLDGTGVILPSIGAGATYMLTPTLQLDLSSGIGIIEEQAEGPWVSAGVSVLF
jgi:hypothetical protein